MSCCSLEQLQGLVFGFTLGDAVELEQLSSLVTLLGCCSWNESRKKLETAFGSETLEVLVVGDQHVVH